MSSIKKEFKIDVTQIDQYLEKSGNPWKNPSQIEHCKFSIEGSRLQFSKESLGWSLNPDMIKISLIGASALSNQLFDGKLRYFSTILIFYSGFGYRFFSDFHVDSLKRSFIWAPNGSDTSYTQAIFDNGEYGVVLHTRRAHDAMVVPQKERSLLLDCGITPDQITCILKKGQLKTIEIEKGHKEFERAKQALFNGTGLVFHRGESEKGLIFENGEYGVVMPTRRVYDAMVFLKKKRCSLLNCGITPNQITCIYKKVQEKTIEIEQEHKEFERAKQALFNGTGLVYHSGGTEKGLVINVSRELPGNGWNET